jgi:hypothetical protein
VRTENVQNSKKRPLTEVDVSLTVSAPGDATKDVDQEVAVTAVTSESLSSAAPQAAKKAKTIGQKAVPTPPAPSTATGQPTGKSAEEVMRDMLLKRKMTEKVGALTSKPLPVAPTPTIAAATTADAGSVAALVSVDTTISTGAIDVIDATAAEPTTKGMHLYTSSSIYIYVFE